MSVLNADRRRIDIQDIYIGSRHRQPDAATVKEIAQSISEIGLMHPPAVYIKDGVVLEDGLPCDSVPVLIYGRHRLLALQELGETHVECIIQDVNDLGAELMEIGENLHRSELTALQRAEHIARWIDLTGVRREAESVLRQPDAKPGRPEGGVRAAARELGLSEPDARRALKVAALSPEAKAAAVEAGLDGNRTALLAAAQETEPAKQVEALIGRTLVAANQNLGGAAAYRTSFSGDNEWYTPSRYVELAREVMGGIDVDPASNDHAQQTVRASVYYTAETNGLDKPWNGKVWMNPPYGRGLIAPFIEKLIEEFQAGRCTEAIVLTNNSTDTGWFDDLFHHSTALCFVRGRIPFESPTRPNGGGLPMGQAFTYFGSNPERFAEVFSAVGNVCAMPWRTRQAAAKAA